MTFPLNTEARGKPNSRAHIEARRKRVLELMAEGKEQPDIVSALGMSRMTLWRDLQALEVKFGEENSEQLRVVKTKVVEALLKAAEEVWEGNVPPDAAHAYRGLISEVSKILGLFAPTKSISASVSLEEEDWVVEFRRSAQGLSEQDFPLIWDFIRALPRKARTIDASCLPPKELSDGSDRVLREVPTEVVQDELAP